MTITAEQAQTVLHDAELLYSQEHIAATLDKLAQAISAKLAQSDPLMLVVMNGALMPASELFMRMAFPFRTSYIHVTRYRGNTSGGSVYWVAKPDLDVEGRVVLVIDDILDEGTTLKAIIDELRAAGASEVYSAVLVNKQHDRKEAGLKVDFVGMDVPDRYVFGFGMDYKEYWRNLPAIYAVKDA
ncbi:MAG: hypoxanthine-guanine phosphoribosyltransferase [Candidatus Competibacteraceae bacterium]|nr:hypoxanthine-guanine phosphoribosyltransferase [Candidatus Competibacteraceae bacterium]MCB1814334.1 hypoxanthine-guanine phosphoribosyltransferase [Candidatus Competibacteraceae bacterium]